MSQLRNQIDQDVERLRKAADRIRKMRDENLELAKDRAVAVQSLKIIATWAAWIATENNPGISASNIHDRAMDTLRLMGEAK